MLESGTASYPTGVIYADTDHNDFYSIGEGRGGVDGTARIRRAVLRRQADISASSGGYGVSVANPNGNYDIAFSGGGLSSAVTAMVHLTGRAPKSISSTVTRSAVRSTPCCATMRSILTLLGVQSIDGSGNALNNTLIGNSGANELNGAGGADNMYGGKGNDIFYVDNADDVVHENSGQGVDTVVSSISYTLHAYLENLTLRGSLPISGTGNTDSNTITGGSGANTLIADIGNDTLDGGAGADTMYGGKGNDTYIVDNADDLVHESNGQGTDTIQSSISYTLAYQVENLTLMGSSAVDGSGNVLSNVIMGNSASNTLTGGGGDDTFVFNAKLSAGNVDHVTDFALGHDEIALVHSIFAQAGGVGTLASGAFYIGSSAYDASDRIIYNSATGALYCDDDGNGAHAAVQFAQLAAGLALANSDFVVI